MFSQLQRLQQVANRPLTAYLALALLQLKLVWRIWDYKDLTFGDTSSYFYTAYGWYKHLVTDIVWSPLYTSFYGSLLNISSDVYTVTTLHRLIIVFVTSLLVLAVLRQLLPHGIAWIIAAWWVVLPINFDTLYEVHLFAVIPILVACLLLFQPSAWAKGGAIAILGAVTVLVRNELSLVTGMLVVVCLAWEVWQFRRANPKRPLQISLKTYGLSYGIPLFLALLSILFFYWRSSIKFPELTTYAAPKHTLNVCQIYAFGYQQRYSDWTGSPWTECMALMKRQFGQEMPTLFQALKANPPAMLEHFWWNFSLALNGIQVSLFNSTSGSINPDYAPVHLNQSWVIIPTLLTGMIAITGLIIIFRDRHYWWQFWLKERILAWSLLLSVSALGFFVVIPMQRPRPSYLFGLTLFLMALVGMGLFAITHRWQKFQKAANLLPVLMVALLIIVPSYYVQNHAERRLLGFYRLFTPYQAEISRPKTVFLNREFSFELRSYLRQEESCQGISYGGDTFFSAMAADMSLEAFLNQKEVDLFYADNALLTQFKDDPRFTRFFADPKAAGWELIGLTNTPTYQGQLLKRSDRQG